VLADIIDCKQQPAAAVVACTAGENKPLPEEEKNKLKYHYSKDEL